MKDFTEIQLQKVFLIFVSYVKIWIE